MNHIEKIKIKGLRNARDIATLSNGDINIKNGKIIRSSRLDEMKKKDLDKFITDYNITTIIDLRTDTEIEERELPKYPSSVSYYHIPILDKAYWGITHEKKMRKVMRKESKQLNKDFNTDKYMVRMYENILYNPISIIKVKEVFDLIKNQDDGALVFHCSGGKDRTGVISLLLFTILGIEENLIIDDYIISNKFNKSYNIPRKIGMHIVLVGARRFKHLVFAMMNAKREYIVGLIDSLKNKYGSVMNYIIKELGFGEDYINCIKNKYLINYK